MNSLIRSSTLAAVAAATLIVGLAPSAIAQPNQIGIRVGNGEVECRAITVDGLTHTNCLSATEAAHSNHAECKPPEHLVPSVRIEGGNSRVGCWNQGYDGQYRHLSSPGVTTHGDTAFIADFNGGIHAVNTAGQYAYAGPQGVSDRFDPARLSSF